MCSISVIARLGFLVIFGHSLRGRMGAGSHPMPSASLCIVCKKAMLELLPRFKASRKSSAVVSISRVDFRNCIGPVRITRSCRIRVFGFVRSQKRSMTSAQVRVVIFGSCADK